MGRVELVNMHCRPNILLCPLIICSYEYIRWISWYVTSKGMILRLSFRNSPLSSSHDRIDRTVNETAKTAP